MKFNWKYLIGVFIVISFAISLRFYQLDKIPPGLLLDEASEGYNAFSLLHTGKDRYGESFPILFRSFGSYQAPLYTYFSIIPIYLFGNSIFSIHFVAAFSGVMLIIITILLFSRIQEGNKSFSLVASILIVISPWAIFFSRIGTEANLGVMVFVLSFLMLYLSLKREWFFLPAMFFLGLSTHAYYSERLISVLYLLGYILLFRRVLLKNKKIFFLGLIIFGITQLPHLLIANSGAFTRRLAQVDYFNEEFFQNNSGIFHYMPFGRLIFIIREFFSQYTAYFSPNNLFLNPDPQGARSMPDLSAFYSWMLIPFILGFYTLMKERAKILIKMLTLLLIVAPIPASLTRDPFSTIRILVFLWVINIIIALGIDNLLKYLLSFRAKVLVIIILISLSLIQLYLSYFVLLKYERSENYGYTYLQLLEKINEKPSQTFIVDTTRELGTGVRFAYLIGYDPVNLQKMLRSQIKNKYYSSYEYNEPYILDNIEARPIIWEEDICKKQILIGDLLAISEQQVKEHKLNLIFNIKDTTGNVALNAYQTNPSTKCGLMQPNNR